MKGHSIITGISNSTINSRLNFKSIPTKLHNQNYNRNDLRDIFLVAVRPTFFGKRFLSKFQVKEKLRNISFWDIFRFSFGYVVEHEI